MISKTTRLIVWISAAWSLLALSLVGLFYFEVLDILQGNIEPPSFGGLIALGGGYFIVVLFILLLHVLAIRVTRRSTTHPKRKSQGLVSITGVMFLIVFLTGFSIGLFLLPSAILLLIASILSITNTPSHPQE